MDAIFPLTDTSKHKRTVRMIKELKTGEQLVRQAPARVVIADDEIILAIALKAQFERQGHQVVSIATNGQEALARIREHNPDIVIMDIRMPGMDGIEATRRLMEESPVCVIVLSAFVDYQQNAYDAGAMVFEVKPLIPNYIPSLLNIARERFDRYMKIRQDAPSPEAALQSWLTVQAATEILMEQQDLTEETAFELLEQTAKQKSLSIAEAAGQIVREKAQ